MVLSTSNNHLSRFTTPDGQSFRQIRTAQLPVIVEFLSERVLVRDNDIELSVPIGVAAEIWKQAQADVGDELISLLLGLVTQDFDAALKLPLAAPSEREQARRIVLLAESRGLPVADKQALYDLVARTLIRCGHAPSEVLVPQDRLLTADETLELWISYRLGTPVEAVNELVARFQAAHNPLVSHLFRAWRVIVDRDFRTPITSAEGRAIRIIPSSPPGVKIVYDSNDIPQTAAFMAGEPPAGKETAQPKANVQGVCFGPPRPRISPATITFMGGPQRQKSSLLLDAIHSRVNGLADARFLVPGMHAQVFARCYKDRLDRTKKTPAFDFNVATATHFFGGRSLMGITVKDIDGKDYHPDTFGHSQCEHLQSADGLIIPVDTEALQEGAEVQATEDAIFLARLVEQYRYRPGLPIAIEIPASDKLMSQAELANIPGCRIFPAEAQRSLLTAVTTCSTARLAGGVAARMRHAAMQNPAVARSLNVLRVIDRLFTRYEPLFREACAVTGLIEVFVTVTSTKESGWSRTYGSLELIRWMTEKLEAQIRPILPELAGRERMQLSDTLARAWELQSRITILETRREALHRRREANATARIVWPWNKPDRIQAQDKHAEDGINTLVAELESTLGLQAQADSTIASRRAAITAAATELAARKRALGAV